MPATHSSRSSSTRRCLHICSQQHADRTTRTNTNLDAVVQCTRVGATQGVCPALHCTVFLSVDEHQATFPTARHPVQYKVVFLRTKPGLAQVDGHRGTGLQTTLVERGKGTPRHLAANADRPQLSHAQEDHAQEARRSEDARRTYRPTTPPSSYTCLSLLPNQHCPTLQHSLRQQGRRPDPCKPTSHT